MGTYRSLGSKGALPGKGRVCVRQKPGRASSLNHFSFSAGGFGDPSASVNLGSKPARGLACGYRFSLEIFSAPPLGTRVQALHAVPRGVGWRAGCAHPAKMRAQLSGSQIYVQRRCLSIKFSPGISPRGFLLCLTTKSGSERGSSFLSHRCP